MFLGLKRLHLRQRHRKNKFSERWIFIDSKLKNHIFLSRLAQMPTLLKVKVTFIVDVYINVSTYATSVSPFHIFIGNSLFSFSYRLFTRISSSHPFFNSIAALKWSLLKKQKLSKPKKGTCSLFNVSSFVVCRFVDAFIICANTYYWKLKKCQS